MNELIRIEERDGKQTVNARELWRNLESKQEFANWIKARLDGFIEGKDFLIELSESSGGRPATEYYLTIDTAKHVAMMERTEKGREVRAYFIKVEEAWNSPELVMARALQAASRTIETYRERLFAVESRVDRLIHNNRTYNAGELAKELGFRSAQELNQDLKRRGIQYKDRMGTWLLYAEYSDKGFVEIKQMEHGGAPRYYMKWTGLGRDWLLGLYASERAKEEVV